MSALKPLGVATMVTLLCVGCSHGLSPHVSGRLRDAERFHGHLGPYVLIGQRIGECAMRALSAERYFGVEVIVACSGKPPQSCLVDGLQVSTGATYGKRNITIVEAPEIKVTVTDKKTNRKLGFTLADRARTTIAQMGKDHDGVDRTARLMSSWPDGDLFTIVSEAGSQ